MSQQEIRQSPESYDAFLEKHDKRVRAEALAVCQGKVSAYLVRVRENARKESATSATGLPTNTTQGALTALESLQDLLSDVQPTAKALEELLQQAELRGIMLVHRFEATHTRCRACKRIAELEKAQATSEEKPCTNGQPG